VTKLDQAELDGWTHCQGSRWCRHWVFTMIRWSLLLN